MKIIFKKLKDPDNPVYDRTTVTLTCDDDNLDKIGEAFMDFLRAIGFSYVEEIEITRRLSS